MRTTGWIAVIVLMVLAVGVISWMTREEKASVDSLRPTVALRSISIRDIDSDRIKMMSKIVVHNPLPLTLTTHDLAYALFIDDTKVLQTPYRKTLTIPSGDSVTLTIPMELLADDLTETLKKLERNGADSANYVLKTSFTLDVPVKGETAFKHDITKRLPVMKLLRVTPADIDVNKMTFKESKLEVTIDVENRNAFPVRIKDVAYSMKLGGNLAMEGSKPGVTNLPGNTTTRIPVYFEVKNKEMLQLLSKMIGKSDTKFEVSMRADLVTNSDVLSANNIAMRTQGTVYEIKQAMKKEK